VPTGIDCIVIVPSARVVDGNEYDWGKRDLFTAMIALNYVISKNDYNRLIKEILNALSYLQIHLSIISKLDVLKDGKITLRYTTFNYTNWTDTYKRGQDAA
jgi:hypothetical protein